MCWCVAVAVPERHADAVRAVFGRGYGVHEGVAPVPPPGLVVRRVTTDGCGCALVRELGDGLTPEVVEGLRRLAERAGTVGVVRWWDQGAHAPTASVDRCDPGSLAASAEALAEKRWLVTSAR